MNINVDWKFGLTIVIALASVVVPIWIFQVDLTSKALQVDVLSATPLFPSVDPKLDLKVSQGDKELKSPVLTVLEISNSGSRSIVAADFESPIVLSATRGPILRAAVAEAVPTGLNPILDLANSAVAIRPLLLNPGDKFRVSVLTDGATSGFAIHARIAGVKDVPIQVKAPNGHEGQWRQWVQLVASIPGFAVALALAFTAGWRRRDYGSMPAPGHLIHIVLGIGCSVLTAVSSGNAVKALGFDGLWFTGILLIVVFCALGLASLYVRGELAHEAALKHRHP